MNVVSEIKKIFKDAGETSFILFKILIPVSIIVKILSEIGLVKTISGYLEPVMGLVGLPGDFALVWGTAMITNIYGGLIVFLNLSLSNTYSVAQVTILATMILVAHSFPVEIRIAQKAGVRARFSILFRFLSAIIIGAILSLVFNFFNLFNENTNIIWQPQNIDQSLTQWIINELKNYLMIFFIILALITLIHILKKSGIIEKLNNAFEPGLKYLGMSKNAAPLTIIGLTLGISYGGGLIIKEVQENNLGKKDAFLSVSMLCLSHSLIEDTLIMVSIGASFVGILFARVFFTIIVMIILIQVIKKLSNKTFKRFFSRKN